MARILIVEDNPQNLKLATVILNDAGHEVVAAIDAEQAELQLATHPNPDLILMDLGLPGKDGYELARDLRARDSTRAVPILAVTSFAMRGDARKAIEAGCSDYLTKPIERTALLNTVDRLLGRPIAGGTTEVSA